MAALGFALGGLAPAFASVDAEPGAFNVGNGNQPKVVIMPAPENQAPTDHPLVISVIVHKPPGIDLQGAEYPDGGAQKYDDLVTVHAGEELSRDAVRDSIERLYATGQFSDVVVTREDQGGGVVLSFDLTARQKLIKLDFEGNTALNKGELIRAALTGLEATRGNSNPGLPVNRYYPEELEAMRLAVERYYDAHGYSQARVTANQQSSSPTEMEASFTIEEGSPTRIRSISASGDPRLDPLELADALGLHLGDVLDTAQLDAAVHRLRERYQHEKHYRASVGKPHVERLSPDEASVAFPVAAGPEIRFHFHGNRTFDEGILEAVLGYNPEDTLDDTEEERAAAKVQRFYRLSGFFDATVRPKEVWSPDQSKLVVVFEVNEGLPLRVTEIHFHGNHHFSEKYLVDRLKESLRDVVSQTASATRMSLDEAETGLTQQVPDNGAELYRVDPLTVFAEDPYKDALARILDLYRADGYLYASNDLPQLDIDERTRTAVVQMNVIEGPQTLVRNVKLEWLPEAESRLAGAKERPPDSAKLVSDKTTLKPNQPLNGFEVEATRQALVKELKRRGYYFAKVQDPLIASSDDHTRADVIYQASLGPLVHVHKIIPTGNDHTYEGVITSVMSLKEGDILNPEKLDESQRTLATLGIFSRETLRVLDPDHEDVQKDVVVEVEEQPRQEREISGGYSLVDGPRVGANWTWADLFDRGVVMDVSLKLNYFNLSYPVRFAPPGPDQIKPQENWLEGFGGHFNLSFRWPQVYFLKPQNIGAHVDFLVFDRINRPAYLFDRIIPVSAGFDWQIIREFTFSLVTSLEYDDIQEQKNLVDAIGTLSPSERQLFLFSGSTFLAAVTPSLTLDLRDNPANPHFGFLLSANAEVAKSLTGTFDFFYWKPTLSASTYLPVGKAFEQIEAVPQLKGMVLALSARWGKVLPLEAGSGPIPPTKRFFLGGSSTLRGFAQDALTPEDLRSDLHSQVENCQRAIQPLGCTQAAQVLAQGNLLPSEGGQAIMLYRAELRVPINNFIELGLFTDVGDLWVDPRLVDYNPLDLRITPGFGLRFISSVLPIAVDTGFNIKPDTLLNEKPWDFSYVQLSIGVF
jgi:outer membrane protein assembly factor BamA